jgi:hypothetical protein
LPLTALASRLAFLPRPMTGSFASCGGSAATYGPRSQLSCRRRDARWLHVPRRAKLKPSRHHVVSSSRISGGEPALERLRILKAGRGKGKQPQTAGNAGHPTEDRGPVRR